MSSVIQLTFEKEKFLKFWKLGICSLFLLIGVVVLQIIQGEKNNSNINHALRMDPNAVEPGKTAPDPMPANTDFVPVHVGIYLDGIENLSIKDSFWSPTFYIWFRWKGDASLSPGKHFRLVDGKIEKKDLQDSYVGSDGTHYEVYKVTAKITKFFNTTRVPLDDHMLNIYIEDSANDVGRMRYVADSAANVSSRVKISGYSITGFSSVIKPHTYKTSYGDPRVAEGKGTTFSEYNFAVSVKRQGLGVYIKLFIGLYAGVLLTFCSFFIRASESGPRYSMPSAAYFGVVANAYMTHTLLPSSGHFGLADMVTFVGLLTISICVIASIVSIYFHQRKKEEDFSRQIDRVSLKYIGIGFLIVNIMMPVCAFY